MPPNEGTKRFRMSDLIGTNPDLDEAHIQELVDGLSSGRIKPDDLDRPFVRPIDGKPYVNDGNHKVEAFKRTGIEETEADWYQL